MVGGEPVDMTDLKPLTIGDKRNTGQFGAALVNYVDQEDSVTRSDEANNFEHQGEVPSTAKKTGTKKPRLDNVKSKLGAGAV